MRVTRGIQDTYECYKYAYWFSSQDEAYFAGVMPLGEGFPLAAYVATYSLHVLNGLELKRFAAELGVEGLASAFF